MQLSALQKYILQQCCYEKNKLNRSKLLSFYGRGSKSPKKNDQINIITKSIERLIGRGLLVGFGVRTTEKWFIKETKVTPKGRKLGRKLLGQQMKLFN
ncbi:MAG: hypothetical protein WC310_03410 [Patescibacteria group bacterium]|jgi:hypothetical protein